MKFEFKPANTARKEERITEFRELNKAEWSWMSGKLKPIEWNGKKTLMKLMNYRQ